ncbi:MAG: hypothetical protein V9E85_13000 [Candidatus Nanopelagicales bacterium]
MSSSEPMPPNPLVAAFTPTGFECATCGETVPYTDGECEDIDQALNQHPCTERRIRKAGP